MAAIHLCWLMTNHSGIYLYTILHTLVVINRTTHFSTHNFYTHLYIHTSIHISSGYVSLMNGPYSYVSPDLRANSRPFDPTCDMALQDHLGLNNHRISAYTVEKSVFLIVMSLSLKKTTIIHHVLLRVMFGH